jgi:hypothetical protein
MMCKKEPDNFRQKAEPDGYEIVRDGMEYGIALGGKVILHGMDSDRALRTLELLNIVQRSHQEPI